MTEKITTGVALAHVKSAMMRSKATMDKLAISDSILSSFAKWLELCDYFYSLIRFAFLGFIINTKNGNRKWAEDTIRHEMFWERRGEFDWEEIVQLWFANLQLCDQFLCGSFLFLYILSTQTMQQFHICLFVYLFPNKQ